MDAKTQQLAHKVGIFLAAGLIAVSMLFILLVAFLQGDGHALAVANELEPYVLTTMGSLLGLLGVNTVVSGLVAFKQASANAQAATAIASGNPATVSVAAGVAQMAQTAPAPTPAPPAPATIPVVPAGPATGPTPADIING